LPEHFKRHHEQIGPLVLAGMEELRENFEEKPDAQ
jgi:hypothetical protein